MKQMEIWTQSVEYLRKNGQAKAEKKAGKNCSRGYC